MVYSLQSSDETAISSRERTNDAVDLLVRFEDLIETSDFGWLDSFRCNGGYGETETNYRVRCMFCRGAERPWYTQRRALYFELLVSSLAYLSADYRYVVLRCKQRAK